MIAALFVERGGVYWDLPGVDAWDKERDARLYAGPWPVVAHPPCERWGNFWFGGTHPQSRRYELGDDGGCFASALASIRRWGGVLEHPEGSRAWRAFGLTPPPHDGSWTPADWPEHSGWTCCVEQGAYGHPARKRTWLYAAHVTLPSLKWGKQKQRFAHLRATSRQRMTEREMLAPPPVVARSECAATPIPFRDLLLSIAASARQEVAA